MIIKPKKILGITLFFLLIYVFIFMGNPDLSLIGAIIATTATFVVLGIIWFISNLMVD